MGGNNCHDCRPGCNFLLFPIPSPEEAGKAAAEMKNSLEVGDEITTIGGIIGEIISIKDETCVIETTGIKQKSVF